MTFAPMDPGTKAMLTHSRKSGPVANHTLPGLPCRGSHLHPSSPAPLTLPIQVTSSPLC